MPSPAMDDVVVVDGSPDVSPDEAALLPRPCVLNVASSRRSADPRGELWASAHVSHCLALWRVLVSTDD